MLKTSILSLALAVLPSTAVAERPPGNGDGRQGTLRQPFVIRARADSPKYVPGEVLVRFRRGVPKGSRDAAHSMARAQSMRALRSVDRLELVRLPEGSDVDQAIRNYRRNPDVLYAEPNYTVQAFGTPNDPGLGNLWGLHNTGQAGGVPDADIDATEAWDLTTGSSEVVIAILDSGIDYTHPDLVGNVFRNEAECDADGVDDDGNGYIDDCHGIDTVNGDSDPADDNGHGTHVAGTIGATGNNGVGVVGVNWQVRLLSCKFLNIFGGGDVSAAITCLDYIKQLRDRGVRIVATNNSWGGGFFSQALMDAIDAQRQSGILFIAAAGNEFNDNDRSPTYPANYDLPNVISVAASTRADEVALFTNYGRRSVHLAAPGQDILSTVPSDAYAFSSGTSMASPHVAGVAALIAAHDPAADWRSIKNLLLAGGDELPALQQNLTRRRLNAYGALTCTDTTLLERLTPIRQSIAGSVGAPVALKMLHIRCAQPNGAVQVSVSPTAETVTLVDDGSGGDVAAGDGVYSAHWVPSAVGSYALTFPTGEIIAVDVLETYSVAPTAFNYRTIAGTSLDLGDDEVAVIDSPFGIKFGGGTFNQLNVSANGTISFTEQFADYFNINVPVFNNPVVTLAAPMWDDLYPVPGSAQNVYWEVLGAAPDREVVVEWRNVRQYACRTDPASTVRFQVVFFENSSDVLFQFTDTRFGGPCERLDFGSSATVGMQVSPQAGTLWSANRQVLTDGTALSWKTQQTQPPPNPVPSVTSVEPARFVAGDQDVILTVRGLNFIPTSQALFLFGERPTTFVSATELRVLIPASAFRFDSGRVEQLRVSNPSPGGGLSNGVSVTIENPAPVITSLSPATAVAGGFSFALDVTGTGFNFSSVVRWNGQDRLTFQFDPNRVLAIIPLTDIANTGSAQVTVSNGQPGGGLSNPLTFAIEPRSSATAFVAGPEIRSQTPSEDSRPKRQPTRFLGWNYAARAGQDYLRRFARPRARAALAPATVASSDLGSASSLSSGNVVGSPTPPAVKLRPSLPADFLPTGIVSGDFNADGHIDWVVSNGGSNNLWVYLGTGDGKSANPTIIPVAGRSPVWLATADLRKNGKLDLIMAEADSGTVGVLLGRGDGTFEPETQYFVPGVPIFVVLGDFTGDGHTDILALLLGGQPTDIFALLPGTGSGAFGAPIFHARDFPEDAQGAWGAAGDFDGDGDLDVAVIEFSFFVGGVVTYLNDGAGKFKRGQQVTPHIPDIGLFYLGIAAAELTGDGCRDLVVTNTFGIANTFAGKCDGTFAPVSQARAAGQGELGFAIELGDLNGDGHLDAVVPGVDFALGNFFGTQSGTFLSVLLGDGAGGFSRARVYRGESSAFALTLADVNGDARPDVVAANLDSDSTTMFLNDGTGGFGVPDGNYIGYFGPTNTEGGVINSPIGGAHPVDVDNDGDLDLVLQEVGQFYPRPYQVTALLNDGTGRLGAPLRSPVIDALQSWGDVLLADFRNTGRPDFVAIGSMFSAGHSLLVFAPNLGNGQFGLPTVTQPPDSQGTLGAGDFNNDGKLDIVVAGIGGSGAAGRLSVFLGSGTGTFAHVSTVTFGAVVGSHWPQAVHVGDFNRDGKADVLVWMYENVVPPRGNDLYQFLGNGDGTFAPPRVVLPNADEFAVGDVNSDGWPDIVRGSSILCNYPAFTCPPKFSIHIGQADGTFVLQNTYSPYAGSTLLLARGTRMEGRTPSWLADFNGDGKLDIAAFQGVLQVFGRTYIQFLAGQGDGSFVPNYLVYPLHTSHVPRFAADLDQDGRADMIELEGYTASFNVLPGLSGQQLQLALVTEPLLGSEGKVRIYLNAASASPTNIALTASDPAITIPAAVDVPAGTVTLDVPFQIGAGFDRTRVFSITGQLGSESAVAYGAQAAPGSGLGVRVNADSSFVTVLAGATSQQKVTVFVVSVSGYKTTVELRCDGLPQGASCAFETQSLDVPSGEVATTSLLIATDAAIPLGTYDAALVVSDGNAEDRMPLRFNVGDFVVRISPTTQDILAGRPAFYRTSIDSINNFAGAVDLICTGLPGNACGTPNLVSVGSSFDASITTTNLPAGNYQFTLTGTIGPVSHAATAELRVTDFTAAVTPTTATIAVGSSADFNIAITGLNGFRSDMTFSCGAPSGVVCEFTPAQLAFPDAGTTAVLRVRVNARPPNLSAHSRATDRPPGASLWLLVALGLVAGIRRRRWPRLGLMVTLFAVSLLMGSACGGGGGGGGGSTPPPSPPQPPSSTSFVMAVQATTPGGGAGKEIARLTIQVP